MKFRFPNVKPLKQSQKDKYISLSRGTYNIKGIIANDLNPKPSLVLWNAHSLLSKAVWAKEHAIDFKIDFYFFFGTYTGSLTYHKVL